MTVRTYGSGNGSIVHKILRFLFNRKRLDPLDFKAKVPDDAYFRMKTFKETMNKFREWKKKKEEHQIIRELDDDGDCEIRRIP